MASIQFIGIISSIQSAKVVKKNVIITNFFMARHIIGVLKEYFYPDIKDILKIINNFEKNFEIIIQR